MRRFSILIVGLLATPLIAAGPMFKHSDTQGPKEAGFGHLFKESEPAAEVPESTATSFTPGEPANNSTMPAIDSSEKASSQREFENVYHDIQFPKISTGTAQNFTIVNASFTNINATNATIGSLNALAISPAISATLGTISATDSLSTMLSKIINARIVQIVEGTATGLTTTTSASFTNTNLAVTITLQAAANKVLLLASGAGGGGTQAIPYYYTIARGNTNLGGSNGMTEINIATGGAAQTVVALTKLDAPLMTGATTYNLQYKSDGVRTAFWGDTGVNSSLIAVEIGQ